MSMLTREQLDTMGCSHCGANGSDDHQHGPLFIHSKCHPEDPTWAFYVDGVILVKCAVCDEVIVGVKVAAT